jgi:cupin 2 domain-containing protein
MNLFETLPTALDEELVEVLATGSDIRIERIVSRGHACPEEFWYDQDLDEWVVVLQGEARLQFDDTAEPLTMKTGDYITIRAHRRHRVAWTSPDATTIWLAVHYRR